MDKSTKRHHVKELHGTSKTIQTGGNVEGGTVGTEQGTLKWAVDSDQGASGGLRLRTKSHHYQ
jgi:hypothetical protein